MKKVFLIPCIFLTTAYSFAAARSRLNVRCRIGTRVGMPQATQSAIHGIMGEGRGVQTTDDGLWDGVVTPRKSSIRGSVGSEKDLAVKTVDHARKIAEMIVDYHSLGDYTTALETATQYRNVLYRKT